MSTRGPAQDQVQPNVSHGSVTGMGSRRMNGRIWGSREKQSRAPGRMSSCMGPESPQESTLQRVHAATGHPKAHWRGQVRAQRVLICTPRLPPGFQQMHKTGGTLSRRPGSGHV